MKILRIVALTVCATVLAGSIAGGDFTRRNYLSPVDSLRLLAHPPAIGRMAVFLTGRLMCTVEFR
jgi:hypothetical protein